MSRCFPFPPPGYERKLRIDDGNLIAKEKDKEKKEKKHKKEKDREKKEGKEKDKEKSKERHREKDKEKKEKHKHKDKDKKKEKNRTREEKRFGESLNVEKVGSNSPQSNQLIGVPSVQELGRRLGYVDGATTANQTVHKISEAKSGVEQKANGQRDNNNSQTRFPKVAIVCNLNGLEQRKTEIFRPMEKDIHKQTEGNEKQKYHRSEKKGEKNKFEDGKRFEGQTETYHSMEIDHPPKEAAFVQELGRRIRDENGAVGSQVVSKVNSIVSQKRAESIGKVPNGNATSYSSQTKEISGFGNGVLHIKENGTRDHNVSTRGPKVAIVHNFQGAEQRGREMIRPVVTESNTYGAGSGAIGIMKEKKTQLKREVKEEKLKQGSDCIIKLSRLGESGAADTTDSSKQNALKASNKPAGGINAKRKEPESNGFVHDGEMRPNKVARTAVSFQPPPENGRKLQSGTTITLSASKQQVTSNSNSLKLMDRKKHKPPNGMMMMINAQQESSLASPKPPPSANTVKTDGPIILAPDSLPRSVKPPFTTPKTDVMTRAQISPPTTAAAANGTVDSHGSPLESKKPSSTSSIKAKHKDKDREREKSSSKPPPPHPDTKYLSQILSLPKVADDWLEFDYQDWLFDKKSSSFTSLKETKLGVASSAEEREDVKVWDKAVHIDPPDFYALPYVIPY